MNKFFKKMQGFSTKVKLIGATVLVVLSLVAGSFIYSPVVKADSVDLYWYPVAGTGTGNWNGGGHWATAADGTGLGHADPTATNNVFFTSTSFTGAGQIVTVNSTANCADMTWTGATNTPTLAGASVLNIYGSSTLVATMNVTMSNSMYYMATSTGKLLTQAGVIYNTCGVLFNGTGGGWQLQDALNLGSNNDINVYRGTLDTNGKTVTCSSFMDNNNYGSVLTFGASTINCASGFQVTGTNTTVNANTSIIKMSGSSFYGGGETWNEVQLLGTAPLMRDASTFTTLTRTSTATLIDTLTLYANQTVTGALNITGNAAYRRVLVNSDTFNTPRTINCTGATTNFTDVDFQDIVISGSPTVGTNVRVGDCGGNTGQTFTAGAPKYWVPAGTGGTGSWSDATNHWATSDGGAAGVNNYPLPQDTALFVASSVTAGGKTITMDEPRYSGIDFSGVTNTPNVSAALDCNFYGSVNLTGINTLTNNGTWFFYGRGNNNLTTGGKTIYTPTINTTVNGSITLLDTLTVSNFFTLTSGTLNFGTQNASIAYFTAIGGTLSLGSGTITMTGHAIATNWSVVAGVTVSASTGTIVETCSDTSPITFAGGGKIYNNLTQQGEGNYALTISGSNTFSTLTVDASAAAKTLKITNSTTQTVSNFTRDGGTNVVTIANTSGTTAGILKKVGGGTISLDYVAVSYNTAQPSFAWSYGAHGSAGSGVTGWVAGTPTESLYWVGNGGNWTDATNHWAIASNGSPNAAYIPDATVSVTFDASSFSSGSQSVTVNGTANCFNMDWTNATNTPTFAGSSALNVYGNLTFIAGMTQTYTGIITFAAIATGKTFTAGKTLACPITFNGVGGAWTLQDALNTTDQTITLIAGSLITNSQAVTTTGIVTISGTTARTFNMSGSTVTCGTWTATTTTLLTFTTNGTSIIVVTGASTFNGGSLTNYNEVDLNNAAITIAGSNTFANLVLPSGTTQTIKFTNGTTQTVANASLSGSAGHVHTLTNSSSTATWAIAKTGGGTVMVSYCTITYSVASPAVTWYYDGTCTYNSTSGWNTIAPSITNSPTSVNFGIVMPNTIYYAYTQSNSGSYPNPVTSSECYFTITNTGGSSCNIALSCSNATGGNAWTLVSSSPTGDQFEVVAVYNGLNPASGLVLTNANQAFYTGLAASATLLWDFKEILGGTGTGKAGTFSDSATKTYSITITGS